MLSAATGSLPLDFKVSKGMSERGYGAVRLSVVGSSTEAISNFSFSAPFVHSWTDLVLHTTVKEIGPSNIATFSVGGQQVTVRLPAQGAMARGFFIADPCISSRDLYCPYAEKFQTLTRLVNIVNTVVASNEIDFWGIVGDNFYEAKGPIGAQFFQALSPQAKSKLFLAVPGNHDFWLAGGPPGTATDQLGHGFFQYYGQDTEAGLHQGGRPYDFSFAAQVTQLAPMENFVFSHQIGNIAFFGYSGAHSWTQLQPYARKFCAWMTNAPTVNTAVILGHWNEDNLGCTHGMSSPDVYAFMKTQPGCSSKTLMYVDGHEHCNKVTEPGHGFMIGGNGMGGCGQFGFMILESNPAAAGGPDVRVDYFELAKIQGSTVVDSYPQIFNCLSSRGYLGCRDQFAQKWRVMYPTLDLDDDGPRFPTTFTVLTVSLATLLGLLKVVRCRKAREPLLPSVAEAPQETSDG